MANTDGTDAEVVSLFASGLSSPLGKYTEPVKTWLDDATYNEWLRLCAARDRKSSELLRDLVYLVVHNQTPAELAAKDTRSLLQGEGPNAARERMGQRA